MSFFEEKKKRERKKKPIVLRVKYDEVEKEFGLTPSQVEKKSSFSASGTKDVLQQQTLSDKRKLKNIFVQSMDLCLTNLPEKTDIHCYWDKHAFDSHPIGCPIKYYINKNGENVYETFKIFCGFNCLAAHIDFVKKYGIDDHIYKESDTLILQMYMDIYDTPPPKGFIKPAHDWSLLKAFGGQYEIDDFRKCNDSVCITSTHMRVRPFPTMISSAEMFDKKCVF